MPLPQKPPDAAQQMTVLMYLFQQRCGDVSILRYTEETYNTLQCSPEELNRTLQALRSAGIIDYETLGWWRWRYRIMSVISFEEDETS